MTANQKPTLKSCQLESLPTLPGIAMQILNTVRSEKNGAREVGAMITKDPSLSAAILKMVNSSYYGLKTKVASIPHAVGILGDRTVKNLALSFCLLKSFNSSPDEQFDISQFWKTSLIAAIATQELAKELMPGVVEEAFMAGLLHDIGIIAMLHSMPKQYQLVLNEVDTKGCSFYNAERQVLGVSHPELGVSLLESWGLPEILLVPIGCHHDPELLATDDPKLVALTQILHLGARFSELMLYPQKTLTLGLIEKTARNFGFQDKMNLEHVAVVVQKQSQEIFPLFELSVDSEEAYIQIIEDARTELIKLSQDCVLTMTRQEQELDHLREQVTRDSMTGLFNYRRFMESLGQEIYRARRYRLPLSIVLSDIDHFKKINDTYGHLAGDMVLQQLAKMFRKYVRTSDLIARYGGEEFAFIFPETDMEGARVITERLRRAVEQISFAYKGQNLGVTISFGIVSLENAPEDGAHELIHKADRALYRAKRLGRNRCCWAEPSADTSSIKAHHPGPKLKKSIH